MLIAKKETEEINLKLNETNKLLEYSNSTKDKFFSIIAHDLKNPFNTLLGASQILNADDSELSEEDKKELIELISNDTKKLYSLLENLLFWARSQTGMLTAKKDSLNLKSIVSDNVQLYKSTAEKKNIIIEVDISENYIVQFDEFMLSTIMRNLLSNAIKFSYSDSKISIVAKDKSNSIILKIIDEGVGIKEEHLGKLFDENSEHKSKGTNNEKGTGLGLLLCRDFADQNNATISVESQIDVGTTFIILFEKAN